MGFEDGQDRLLFGRRDRVHGMAARRAVIERACLTALAPAPCPALAELQVRACPAVIPAVVDRAVDELQQRVLDGRIDTPRDPAVQSQRPFPSASMSLTPISLSASESLAISARAAISSGSGPDLALTPGLEAASASNAPWRAT